AVSPLFRCARTDTRKKFGTAESSREPSTLTTILRYWRLKQTVARLNPKPEPVGGDASGDHVRRSRNLHWHTIANEWNYYLRGKGQVALFGSGGRGKLFDVNPGDAVYIPAGFGHAIRNSGNEDLEIVQTWDNGKFEEIDLDKWVHASPNYLLANNFTGVPESTISKMKQT